jgi:endonuclease-3
MRLKEIAMRVQDEFGGDLDAALREANVVGRSSLVVGKSGISRSSRPTAKDHRPTTPRKILKSFPNIADPGADRILLFAGMEPLGAVPSNNVHVLVRVLEGRERENYGVNYRESRQAIEAAVPPRFDARQRAYLLLKVHGNALCKAKNPKCDECPLRADCAYAAGYFRGRAKAAKVPGSRR